MADRLKILSGGDWEDFVSVPAGVLVLGKSDCEHCIEWSAELEAKLEDESFFPEVQFGKILLDQPGLVSFKRANPWISGLDVLPFNVIYEGGEKKKEWAGGGLERLENRLQRLFGETS